MPGRFLLTKVQLSFSFNSIFKKDEHPLGRPARPSRPERSLSDSSIPTVRCTVGPSELRSVINPNWKDRSREKKDRNVHQLRVRCNTLKNQKKLVQAEEEALAYEQGDGDIEVPFELDETLATSGSTASPAHSLLTTPTFSCSSGGMTPLEFSASFSSSCECAIECIDPSLCNSSFISVGSSYRGASSSSNHQFPYSPPYSFASPSTSGPSTSRRQPQIKFVSPPNRTFHLTRNSSTAKLEVEERVRVEEPCSWATSPQFLSFSNYASASTSLSSTSNAGLRIQGLRSDGSAGASGNDGQCLSQSQSYAFSLEDDTNNSHSFATSYAESLRSMDGHRRESDDSTYSGEAEAESKTQFRMARVEESLSSVLNRGSLMEEDGACEINQYFVPSTTKSSSTSLVSSFDASPTFNKLSQSFSLSPILASTPTYTSKDNKSSSLPLHSPRSDENTIKSIGFRPPHQQQHQQQQISRSPKVLLNKTPSATIPTPRKLSTIEESE
ncbi:uncharacterized protein I303_100647 [Kwoniella dejecticola CBS 10117]|uniref:Uncharacterized protein n=1 Tax=Kwoniella dejecticola CBS 10117 TaxID=1296121 RepID=A0A1A6AFM8_9TREE|nr:uncharacterized protein I303_00650 [Kwoniella dejecticola CBS 10117]OBR88833.1 hypothetical protein I303_00650 [Kwoniella dejecticola CBS 10117]